MTVRKAIDGGFVQLYRDYMPMIRKLNMINPMAANVFLFLAENMDTSNAVACSSKVMEEAFGVCRKTITNAVRDLRELEFVQIYKMGTTNVYTMNANVVWNSWTDGREFAVFKANVMIAASEQDKELVKQIKDRKVKVVDVVEPHLPPIEAFPPDTSIAAAVKHAESTFTTQKPPKAKRQKALPTEPKDFVQEPLPLAPTCKCGEIMVDKVWVKGTHDGKHYWECPARRKDKAAHDFKWGSE